MSQRRACVVAAFAFTVVIILKPFRGANVGMWWGNDNFIVGAYFNRLELIGLMKRILQISVAANGFESGVFVDGCALGSDGPRSYSVEAGSDLGAVSVRDANEVLERLGVIDKSRWAFHARAVEHSANGFGLHLSDDACAAERLLVAFEDSRGGAEWRLLRMDRCEGGEKAEYHGSIAHAGLDAEIEETLSDAEADLRELLAEPILRLSRLGILRLESASLRETDSSLRMTD